MSKKYPYGFFYQSTTNLIDVYGNYSGASFKLPAFLDTVILNALSGNISGDIVLVKNGEHQYPLISGVEIERRYPLILGIERELVAEPGDTFRLVIENGDPSNSLYAYQIGFRFMERYGEIEVSDSSIT